jgi:hypothetical protein
MRRMQRRALLAAPALPVARTDFAIAGLAGLG